jgi:FixJ family two-component response regulator
LIADGRRIPIILITAFCDENIRRRTLGAGASGFLNKPFEDAWLIRCLDKALKSDETGLAQQ